jgi:hypothetical protein
VTADYTDPVAEVFRTVSLNVVTPVSSSKPKEIVDAAWIRKVRLLPPGIYSVSKERLSQALILNPVSDLPFDEVRIEGGGLFAPTILEKNTYEVCPAVFDVAWTVDTITISGWFFGEKAPSVYLEFQKPNEQTWRYRKLKMVKLRTYRFTNAQGKQNQSCMKIKPDEAPQEWPVGYSTITLEYPRTFKYGASVQYIILDNGIGAVPFRFRP